MKTAKRPQPSIPTEHKVVQDREALPPEARRSTGAALLKHAPGWAGDDLEEVLQIVTGTRAKTRF
jgi:hypothetical protein